MNERIIEETWFRVGDLWDSIKPYQRNNLIDGSSLDDIDEKKSWSQLRFSERLRVHDYILNTRKIVSKIYPDKRFNITQESKSNGEI